ncbi:ATP-binding cassette domain-containing protein [Lichenifustis flavocetrariae]|uniref:ATP-binding cassette domain-containing protein n=1 Tax=Lichenifustis flavocetrariae TaxID=2949735 RepID=A0AA41YXR5_9HYPH|nr:ATP-binding cassette domain-containing protein [Lichenifustis flavocetrariae]MCW6509255.1 ATP-binding cassette domain-containing protein [Lichenifustis flavocetrariae]
MLEPLSKPLDKPGVRDAGTVTLKISGVSKYFGGIRALQDISVEFYEGEVHAILGENGAGKSTLMGIISGALQPSAGEISFGGDLVSPLSPERAATLGISISFQHPAILDDLSVLENFEVALPRSVFQDKPPREVARAALDLVGLHLPLRTRADVLTVAQKHLLEIAKALAIKPKVLIFDEPTASLDQEATDMLFGRIREMMEAGTSVIYITHRLAEVRLIAQRVTVLRDGRVRGVARVDEISDADVLGLIVGRTLGSAFPPKSSRQENEIDFAVQALSGRHFSDVSFEAARGQIIGVAGVAGNGQSELMRALAGLQKSQGAIRLKGRTLDHQSLVHEAAFMPSDRHSEGLASGLTVRENATFAALEKFATYGVLSRKEEMTQVVAAFRSLAVKAPGMEAPILSLSGGNQQKVVMARALLSKPGLIVADEPTQGVDVGARAEIYRILRETSNAGTPVIVNSSDAAELEGLCDKVIVLSRGHVVATLSGKDVNEARIVSAAVGAATHIGDTGAADRRNTLSGWRHFLQSDNAPTFPLTIVTALLGLYIFSQNSNFLSSYNVANILLAATALGFIALGQTVALLVGGIDLSVGPLAGFLVVIASFFVNEDQSFGMIAVGFFLMFGGALVAGLVNGILIRFANFTAIAATLATYIGIQGLSFLLRDSPGGYINAGVVDIINRQIGPIPIAFLVLVAFALAGEYALRRSRPGWRLRAIGCDQDSARRVGVQINRTYIAAFVLSALFTACGAVMLMAQIGVGDPRQGANYTLSSITAVVLGGTSLRGGRGTFIGTVLGALLLTEVLNAVAFLGLSETYQYVFQGGLILISALIYSTVQRRGDA